MRICVRGSMTLDRRHGLRSNCPSIGQMSSFGTALVQRRCSIANVNEMLDRILDMITKIRDILAKMDERICDLENKNG